MQLKLFEAQSAFTWEKIKPIKKVKPLGATSPYAWVIEPAYECNLKCAHCCARLKKPDEHGRISEKTWRQTFEIMNEVTPTCRVDLCLAGEPTLHNELPKLLRIARELCPLSQIQITTNGTTLLKGKYTFKQLLDAGANIVYADMYGSKESFLALAQASGYPFYEYYNAPENAPSPWTYYGPDIKVIVLQVQPGNWPTSRKKAGLLGTWYNNLDWEAAKSFNLSPVTQAPARRCNQPFVYVTVNYAGKYLLCCQDGMGETAGDFGTVDTGVPGFKKFWYGERLQRIRLNLRNKNRAGNPQCQRCNITFSRCDYIHWTEEEAQRY